MAFTVRFSGIALSSGSPLVLAGVTCPCTVPRCKDEHLSMLPVVCVAKLLIAVLLPDNRAMMSCTWYPWWSPCG